MFFLRWDLNPVPTIQAASSDAFKSCFRAPVVPRKDPTNRTFSPDEIDKFNELDQIKSLDDFKEKHAPAGYEFRKGPDYALFYKVEYDESGIVPTRIFGSVHIDDKLHVKLQCNGSPVPLPEFFRKGNNCRLTSLSAFQELITYLKNLCEAEPFPFIEELNARKFYKPQGRPPFSSGLIRYSLLLRHTSRQTYKLLLERFPLPSFSLLKKIQQVSIDSYKTASIL